MLLTIVSATCVSGTAFSFTARLDAATTTETIKSERNACNLSCKINTRSSTMPKTSSAISGPAAGVAVSGSA